MQARHQIAKLQRKIAGYQSEIAAHQKIQEAWKSLQIQPKALGPATEPTTAREPAAPSFANTQPL